MKKFIIYRLEDGIKKTVKEVFSFKTKMEIRMEYAYLNFTGIDSINC